MIFCPAARVLLLLLLSWRDVTAEAGVPCDDGDPCTLKSVPLSLPSVFPFPPQSFLSLHALTDTSSIL